MSGLGHAVVFVANGLFWLALLMLVAHSIDGAAYWAVGGVVVVLSFASIAYFARRGMQASVRRRADTQRK